MANSELGDILNFTIFLLETGAALSRSQWGLDASIDFPPTGEIGMAITEQGLMAALAPCRTR